MGTTVIDALRGEHGVFHGLFDLWEKSADSISDLERLREISDVIGNALSMHAQVEDELLFSTLESLMGPNGPIARMRFEHNQIDKLLDQARRSDSLEQHRSIVRELLGIVREHFQKEEHVLFHLAQQFIGDQQLGQLGVAWSRRRSVAID